MTVFSFRRNPFMYRMEERRFFRFEKFRCMNCSLYKKLQWNIISAMCDGVKGFRFKSVEDDFPTIHAVDALVWSTK